MQEELNNKEAPRGYRNEPYGARVSWTWFRKHGQGTYGRLIYAVREFIHGARAARKRLNACRTWTTLSGTVLSFEDDGTGMSTEQLNSAMDIAPDDSEGLPLISFNGEGMKMAAISLVQEEGFIIIFSKQKDIWTTVTLDLGDRRQVQHNSLAMPADLVQPATERSLALWYTDQGFTDPHFTIARICRLPTSRSGDRCNGHLRSPYDELSDIQQVFLRMKGKDSGFRLEIHLPSAPGVQQPYKIGSFDLGPACCGPHSSAQAGWRDIQLTDYDGQRQLLTELLPQLFLPYPGQDLWPDHSSTQPPHQLRMYVNGREVSQDSNIWSRVLRSGGQPSQKLPIKHTRDAEMLGSMQIMQLPPSWPADAAAAATGIIFVMPGADAVFNLQPELPDQSWRYLASAVQKARPSSDTILELLAVLAGGAQRLNDRVDGAGRRLLPREVVVKAAGPLAIDAASVRRGRAFLRGVGLVNHLAIVQLQPNALTARMARDKTCPNTDKDFNGALFRAVIRYFKSEWDKQERAARAEDRRVEGGGRATLASLGLRTPAPSASGNPRAVQAQPGDALAAGSRGGTPASSRHGTPAPSASGIPAPAPSQPGRGQQGQTGQESSLHTAGSSHRRPSVSSQAAVSTPAARPPLAPRKRSVKRPHPVTLKLEQGVFNDPLPPASQGLAPQSQVRLPGNSGATNQSQRPQALDPQAQPGPNPQRADLPDSVQLQQPLPSNTARSAPAPSQPVSSQRPAGRSAAASGGQAAQAEQSVDQMPPGPEPQPSPERPQEPGPEGNGVSGPEVLAQPAGSQSGAAPAQGEPSANRASQQAQRAESQHTRGSPAANSAQGAPTPITTPPAAAPAAPRPSKRARHASRKPAQPAQAQPAQGRARQATTQPAAEAAPAQPSQPRALPAERQPTAVPGPALAVQPAAPQEGPTALQRFQQHARTKLQYVQGIMLSCAEVANGGEAVRQAKCMVSFATGLEKKAKLVHK